MPEQYSPTPWMRDVAVDGFDVIRSADYKRKKDEAIVCGVVSDFFGIGVNFVPTGDDMNRIVACVNACAGIPTDDLRNPHTKIYVDMANGPQAEQAATSGERFYCILGTERQMVDFSKRLLSNHGFSVTPPADHKTESTDE